MSVIRKRLHWIALVAFACCMVPSFADVALSSDMASIANEDNDPPLDRDAVIRDARHFLELTGKPDHQEAISSYVAHLKSRWSSRLTPSSFDDGEPIYHDVIMESVTLLVNAYKEDRVPASYRVASQIASKTLGDIILEKAYDEPRIYVVGVNLLLSIYSIDQKDMESILSEKEHFEWVAKPLIEFWSMSHLLLRSYARSSSMPRFLVRLDDDNPAWDYSTKPHRITDPVIRQEYERYLTDRDQAIKRNEFSRRIADFLRKPKLELVRKSILYFRENGGQLNALRDTLRSSGIPVHEIQDFWVNIYHP